MAGILVIRGGAMGDFILTLPAIRLLREAFPDVRLEIVGYRHIVALAQGRYYAHAARSIEYAGLAPFFIPGGKLEEEWAAYFAGFDQVVSYLYDPDGFFEANLRRAGVRNLICGTPRPGPGLHAARQLAQPLEQLALYLEAGAEHAPLYPTGADAAAATAFLNGEARRIVAIHPGAGGAAKVWPTERWRAVIEALRARADAPAILLVGGEADEAALAALSPLADVVAANLPLPELGALLARCSLFLGHDSGVSHLAAAAGAKCLLLFGPTDPAVWAPPGPMVRVLPAPGGHLGALPVGAVLAQVEENLVK